MVSAQLTRRVGTLSSSGLDLGWAHQEQVHDVSVGAER